MQKKELVAKRIDGTGKENIDDALAMVLMGTLPGFVIGVFASSIGAIEPISFESATPLVLAVMGATGVVTGLGGQSLCNRQYLKEAIHRGEAVDPKIVKKHLTWKGRISLLPYVGKLVDPRNILSKDAPYTFVRYDAEAKTALELDIAKDPMVSWDALMQSELGSPVEEALDDPKKLEEMQVA